MCSDIAISVRNLTKTYRIFDHPGDRIEQALTFGQMRFHREFTALQDILFEIKKGEAVGIIGHNGSWKSTLMSLVSGILKPTSGTQQCGMNTVWNCRPGRICSTPVGNTSFTRNYL